MGSPQTSPSSNAALRLASHPRVFFFGLGLGFCLSGTLGGNPEAGVGLHSVQKPRQHCVGASSAVVLLLVVAWYRSAT